MKNDGVDDDAGDDAGRAEPHDRPVVPAGAPAPGLPAVVLLAAVPELGARRGRLVDDQVLLGREELVVRRHHRAAEGSAGEIGQAGEIAHGTPLVTAAGAGHSRTNEDRARVHVRPTAGDAMTTPDNDDLASAPASRSSTCPPRRRWATRIPAGGVDEDPKAYDAEHTSHQQ